MSNRKTFSLLFASRLVSEKGVDILIESIEQYINHPDSEYDIVWHICGNGPYQDRILSLQQKYSTSIVYHGFVGQTGLALLYREADFLFMPSLFLETFGLTALEALASGIVVIGFRKGGLSEFIPREYSLDPSRPVASLGRILSKHLKKQTIIDISDYHPQLWRERLVDIFGSQKSITLMHDYRTRIGGAEIYLDALEDAFKVLGTPLSRFSYEGYTSSWKRRILFLISMLSFWRAGQVYWHLSLHGTETLWLHSILRYVGFWGCLGIRLYQLHHPVNIFISHHDLGLLVPFPQDIHEENQIPKDVTLFSFLAGVHPLNRKMLAVVKWCYIRCIFLILRPNNMTHIVFAPFLEKHIIRHFPGAKIKHLPHTYDENIFHH